jgi:hypothetical protein
MAENSVAEILTEGDIAALLRFSETGYSGAGHDLSYAVQTRLCLLGALRGIEDSQPPAIELTLFGVFVVENADYLKLLMGLPNA